MSISGGEIDFIDEQTGRTRIVERLEAQLSAKSLAGPWKIDGRAALDGYHGSFTLSTGAPDDSGEFRLKTRLLPDTDMVSIDLEGALRIVDLKPRYEGNFSVADRVDGDSKARIEAKAAGPRVKGKFELTNESINVPEYRLETGAMSDPYIVTGQAKLDTGAKPEFKLEAEGQQIDISHLGNDGETGKTSRDANVSARIRLQAMLAVLGDIPVPQVPGHAHIKLPAIVAGDTTMRDVELDLTPNGNGWTVDRALAELPGRTKVEAKGELKLIDEQSFKGDLLVASTQPSGLASWLSGSVDPSLRALKTAGFSAKVNLSPDLQQFEGLEIGMGAATLKGRIERQAPDSALPKLSVDLNGNEIDYDALKALVSLFTGAQSEGALFEHSIAAKLAAKQFSAFDVQANDVVALFSLVKGKLEVQQLDIGALAGARISVQGSLQTGKDLPSGNMDALIYADDPGPILQVLEDKLGRHPVLEQLVKNSSYYFGADLKLNLTAGGDEWPVKLTLQGSANGSQINATYSAEEFGISADNAYSLDVALDNPVTSVLLGQLGFQPLPFDGDTNGKFKVALGQNAGEPASAELSFLADHTSFEAKGQTVLDAEHFLEGSYDVSLKADDLESYLLMSGYGLPQLGAGLPGELTAKVKVSTGDIRIDEIAAKLDQNTVSGALSLVRNQSQPVFQGNLDFASLDLPWLGETVLGPLYSIEKSGFSSEKLLPSPIAGLSADLQISAAEFSPGVLGVMNNMSAKLRYGSGSLDLTDVTGQFTGGSAKGRLSVSNASGAGLLQGKLEVAGGDTKAISWVKDDKPLVSGTYDLAFAFESSGKSVDGILQSASGSGTLTLRDAQVEELDTSLFPSILALADQIKGDVTPDVVEPLISSLLTGGTSKLGTVAVPFTLANGKLQADTVAASDTSADLTADAKIDLAAMSIDANVRESFKAGEDALSGADPAITLSWTGPLNQPERSINAGELTNYLSLRAFERERRRVETLQANVLEKQRLRREVALFKWLAAERARMDAEMQMRQLQEDKLKALAKSEEEARQKALEPLPVPQNPGDIVDPAGSGLPGVTYSIPKTKPVQRGSDLPQPGH